MKTFLMILFIPLLLLNAQWQRISEENVGTTAKLMTHNSNVFLYGYQGGFKFFRFDANGENFTDLSASAPAEFSYLYSFNNKLYCVDITDVYTSSDNGETWNLLSTIDFTGGAIIKLTSDGNTLYAVSNRKSIFKSTDYGSTWQELTLNADGNLMFLNLAVTGNNLVGVIVGAGAYSSNDGGVNWSLNNPETGIQNVYNSDGVIIGLTGNGLYKLDISNNTWSTINNGLPNNGTYFISKSLSRSGGSLYFAGSELIGSKSHVFTSSNEGSNWSELYSEGFPQLNYSGSSEFIVSSGTNLFYYYYGLLDSQNIGLYIYPVSETTANESGAELPNKFSLLQNYPNPFNPTTKISFSITQSGLTTLQVYDVLGKEVAELVNENLSAGNYSVDFNASNLSSGIYFYRLVSGNVALIKKMILLR